MKKAFTLFLSMLFLTFLHAQINSNLGNLISEGYTITELEAIFENVTFDNHKKWLQKKGFTFKEDNKKSGYLYYEKNSAVNLTLFYSDKKIIEIAFYSSPQKYYAGIATIEKDKKYRKIEQIMKNNGGGEFENSAKWVYNGKVIYADSDNNSVGIYKDYNNESAKPTVTARPKDLPINNLISAAQYKLSEIGPVYPTGGSHYNGNQKLTQSIRIIDNNGLIEIKKERYAINCMDRTSFNCLEIVTLNLKDIQFTSLYNYKGEKGITSVVCLLVKDYENKTTRKYKVLSGLNSECFWDSRWNNSFTTNKYLNPYGNSVQSLEFTNQSDARAFQVLIDKAIEACQST